MVILPVVIPAGSALSDPLAISFGYQIVRIAMPSAWDGPAPITFTASFDGVDWYDLYHADPTAEGLWQPFEVGVKMVEPGSVLLLPPTAGSNLSQLRIRSGTRSAPVVQTGDRVFKLVCESAA
jgi:hypothetical protein